MVNTRSAQQPPQTEVCKQLDRKLAAAEHLTACPACKYAHAQWAAISCMCRVIASQASVPLVYVPLEAVASKWYGESEKLLSQVFEAVTQLDGAIVFLDELDALATTRRCCCRLPAHSECCCWCLWAMFGAICIDQGTGREALRSESSGCRVHACLLAMQSSIWRGCACLHSHCQACRGADLAAAAAHT